MLIEEVVREQVQQIPWNKTPEIGWWLDQDPVRFYHGTHKKNVKGILESDLYAPQSGPTAGWVSLALEPNTAFGYASMTGGESSFRAAGAKAQSVPPKDRVVLVLEIPQSYFLPRMAEARGHMEDQRQRLSNKDLYEQWKAQGKADHNYYELTEIRLPKKVPSRFIKGYMIKN